MIARLALCLVVLASGALAQSVTTSQRPQSRAPEVQLTAPVLVAPATVLRPVLRPAKLKVASTGATVPALSEDVPLFTASQEAVAQSLRPNLRSAAIVRRAEEVRASRVRGQVCGDPAIQGDAIGRISGRGSCGVDSAVRVRSVAGVTLRPAPTIDCRTAGALKAWVAQGAKPAVGQMGGGISSLRVVSHYACRFRNSASSGRLSEHAFGRAIDIAGIGLNSGQEITVLTDWGRGDKGRALRAMWRSACGPFGTVLGPEANRFHRDHFHFDTARYRSGSYCR